MKFGELICKGPIADRPAPVGSGKVWIADDATPMSLSRDNGTSWDDIPVVDATMREDINRILSELIVSDIIEQVDQDSGVVSILLTTDFATIWAGDIPVSATDDPMPGMTDSRSSNATVGISAGDLCSVALRFSIDGVVVGTSERALLADEVGLAIPGANITKAAHTFLVEARMTAGTARTVVNVDVSEMVVRSRPGIIEDFVQNLVSDLGNITGRLDIIENDTATDLLVIDSSLNTVVLTNTYQSVGALTGVVIPAGEGIGTVLRYSLASAGIPDLAVDLKLVMTGEADVEQVSALMTSVDDTTGDGDSVSFGVGGVYGVDTTVDVEVFAKLTDPATAITLYTLNRSATGTYPTSIVRTRDIAFPIVSATDPGISAGASRVWFDTSAGTTYTAKVRNATNDGWLLAA